MERERKKEGEAEEREQENEEEREMEGNEKAIYIEERNIKRTREK